MPDEPIKPEGTHEGATPAIDTDALMAQFDAKMKENLAQFVRKEPEPEPINPNPPPIVDPLGEMVRQAVDPQLRAVGLRAEAAEDKADFYLEHDDAREYKSEIEKTFQNMFKSGRPMPRADIWNWIKGRDFDKFAEKREERKKKKLEEAAGAATVGEGGRRPIGGTTKDPYDMTEDELGKSVEGVSF